MLFAVLFGFFTQPNKLSPTLTQGGVRLATSDYPDAYRLDSRCADARSLPFASFGELQAAANQQAGFFAAPQSGSWVEARAEGTAARLESALGEIPARDGSRHNGIVIEIDVIIDAENAAAADPVALMTGISEHWMESSDRNKAGTALTKLNNRIDQSRRRERYKDRLRPI